MRDSREEPSCETNKDDCFQPGIHVQDEDSRTEERILHPHAKAALVFPERVKFVEKQMPSRNDVAVDMQQSSLHSSGQAWWRDQQPEAHQASVSLDVNN